MRREAPFRQAVAFAAVWFGAGVTRRDLWGLATVFPALTASCARGPDEVPFGDPDGYGSRQDPTGAVSGVRRVARGGSWAEDRAYLSTVWRRAVQPDFRLKTHGLRAAISWTAARTLLEPGGA